MGLNGLKNGKNMIEPFNSFLACLLHVSKHVSPSLPCFWHGSKHVSTSFHAHFKHVFKHISHSQHVLNMFQSLKTFLEMF
jgi:hypothetical protein